MIRLKDYIIDLYDYARCCLTSKAGMYLAYYIQRQELCIGNKKQINITYQNVLFDNNDIPALPNNPVVINNPNYSAVEFGRVKNLYYDDTYNIVYLLSARIYGGKDGRGYASKIDNRKNNKRHRNLLYSFLHFLVAYTSANSRIGTIKAMPPIKYKDVVGAN